MKPALVLLIAAVCLLSVELTAQPASVQTSGVTGDTELQEAATLAVTYIKGYLALSKRAFPTTYRLIAAENVLQKGLSVWQITFKSAGLPPKEPGSAEVVADSELFVTVDLATKKCTMKHGE